MLQFNFFSKLRINKKIAEFLCIILVVLCIGLQFRHQPAHWDETAYIDGARTIFEAHGFPFVEFWSYKPPLLFEFGAILFGVFGQTIWPLRIFALSIYAVVIWLVKQIITELVASFEKGKKNKNTILLEFFSWELTLLFAVLPVVLGQALLFQGELLLLALWLLGVRAYAANNSLEYWISLSLLLLTKESGVIYLLAIVIVELLLTDKIANKISTLAFWKRITFLLSPLLWFLLWLLGNKYFLGWWLWPFNLRFFSNDKLYDAAIFSKLLGIFWENGNWLVTIVAILGLTTFFVTKCKCNLNKKLLYAVLFGAFFQLLFVLVGAFIPRYVLGIYVLMLFGVTLLTMKLKEVNLVTATLLPIVCVAVLLGKELSVLKSAVTDGWARDQDLRSFTVSKRYQELVEFWQMKYSEKQLYGDWLSVAYFTQPLFGYVSKSLTVVAFEKCPEYSQRDTVLLMSSVDEWPTVAVIEQCASALNLVKVAEFGQIVVYTASDEANDSN